MKRLFAVLAYCDNPIKKKVLGETIEKLKSENPNDLVAVITHYPVDVNIQEICDYVHYDKSNPKVNYFLSNWHQVTNEHRVTWTVQDYGYSVFNLIKNSIHIGNNLNCTEIVFINYDVIWATDDLNKFVQSDKSVLLNNIEFGYHELILFKLIREDYNKLLVKINPERYLSILESIEGSFPEHAFTFLINNYVKDFTTLSKSDLQINEIISMTDNVISDDVNLKISNLIFSVDKKHLFIYILFDKEYREIDLLIGDELHQFKNTHLVFKEVSMNFKNVKLNKLDEKTYNTIILAKDDIDLDAFYRYVEFT